MKMEDVSVDELIANAKGAASARYALNLYRHDRGTMEECIAKGAARHGVSEKTTWDWMDYAYESED